MPSPNLRLAVLFENWQSAGFGLYVHWPFCQAKCPYCDFNSHVAAEIDQSRWIRAYLTEIRRVGSETQDRVLNSLFFGGGTPSLMRPDLVASILEAVHSEWATSNDFEVTLEANPTSVEAERFAAYHDAGVNRVSIGIQALNDADLKALGRLHSVSEARAAYDLARNTFERVSFDLIYARQFQTLRDWRAELTEALSMAADHMSLYQLTIEDGTAFGDRLALGKLRGLPKDEDAADMYLATQDICQAAGLPAYEVSNHAVAGAESRHNLIYWRNGDYAGIGPGAHGRLTLNGQRLATDTPLSPSRWLQQVERTGNGEYPRQSLSGADQAAEYLMMGLRLSERISLDRYEALADSPLNSRDINMLQDLSLVEVDPGRMRVTQSGRPVLNAIIRELLISSI